MAEDPNNRESNGNVKRDGKGRFVRGHAVANPMGRPKQAMELRVTCRKFTPEIVDMLVEIVGDGKRKDSDRIKAGELLLAYGYGRPTQFVGEDPDARFKRAADGAVEAIARIRAIAKDETKESEGEG